MEAFEQIFTLNGFISLFTLTVLEIVLGIDNIIFISIIADKLPKDQQGLARNIGILLALAVRIALLFGITWLIGLTEPLFDAQNWFNAIGLSAVDLGGHGALSGKDLILLGGGLFLIAKSTSEIHAKLELSEEEEAPTLRGGLAMAIVQIILVDMVFSFDSILTAVGLVGDQIGIMVTAVIISMVVMLVFIKKISNYINAHPTLKMLALSFLIVIGVMLTMEALQVHVSKGAIYFAMAFSFLVELLNMRLRKGKRKPQRHIVPESEEQGDAGK